MNTVEMLVQQVLNGEPLSDSQISSLTPEEPSVLTERLKEEADRHWRIDPRVSLRCGGEIIHVGEGWNDHRMVALGTMARGDALRNLHKESEGWQTLQQAGEIYLAAGDEVGWARTRIGKLAICVEMNETAAALQDAETARSIFRACGEFEKLIRLEVNMALVFNYLHDFHAAIKKCHDVLELIESVGPVDNHRLVFVYSNLGYAHQGLGNLQEALHWYEKNRELMLSRGEERGIALADLNVINIFQALGHNKKALLLLHKTVQVLEQHQALETIRENLHVIDCYLFFNRVADARNLAHKVIQQHSPDHHHGAHHDDYSFAQALLLLGVAELAYGNFHAALEALEQARQILEHLDIVAWSGLVHLYRGQAALRLGDLLTARQAADLAAERFRQGDQQISYLMARLLLVRIEIASEQFDDAYVTARDTRKMAYTLRTPHLSYDAHLLLGQISERAQKPLRAIRHYQVANSIMERIQRSLVLTTRAEFLADKQESVQALLRLYLSMGQTEAAFATLERAKAQVWLGYLSQLDHLRWITDDPQTRPLIQSLSQLREEHHWYYRIAHDQVFREQQHATIVADQALREVAVREQQMRALTEQLYLYSSAEDLAAAAAVPTAKIQAHLTDEALMVAYYSDGDHMWAFLLDSHSIEVSQLPESAETVKKLLDKWQLNINRALRTTPGSEDQKILHENFSLPLSQRLYDALIRPFEARLARCKRLVIVPYGPLHYLPFQMLHDGNGYLIERTEVVIYPTASLIDRQPPRQKPAARAIAYSWDGRLRYSLNEAQNVVARFGGTWHSEHEAHRSILEAPPCQVLHISAHGQYRIDQPDFSYIQLADGPLYTDDLFQYDLRYELVTLSACETGRSHAVAGDELIGLGRGFLFAGAGALVASLWRVNEALTLELMDTFYRSLDRGVSKAAALREAQLGLMRAYPGLHPAFWGAFELIGNADPLTQNE
jgi:CHAT domain-containing protein